MTCRTVYEHEMELLFHSNRTEKGTGVRGCVELGAEGSSEFSVMGAEHFALSFPFQSGPSNPSWPDGCPYLGWSNAFKGHRCTYPPNLWRAQQLCNCKCSANSTSRFLLYAGSILFQLYEVLEKRSEIMCQRAVQWLPRARGGNDHEG